MNVIVLKMFRIEMKNTNNFEMIRTKPTAQTLIAQIFYFLFQSWKLFKHFLIENSVAFFFPKDVARGWNQFDPGSILSS